MDVMTTGVYQITNINNGRFYIGSSYNIENRIKSHFSLLQRGKHNNLFIQRDYVKYNQEGFFWTILEVTEKELLLVVEDKYITAFYDATLYCYNISKSASAPMKGRIVSEATREKLRIAHTGRKHSPETLALLKKIKGDPANRKKVGLQMKGKKHKPDSIEKMKVVQKGRIVTEESIRKMKATKKGVITATAHTRQLMSNAHKGRVKSKEEREKLSKANKGKRPSEACIRASKEAHLGKKQDPEMVKRRVAKAMETRKRNKEAKLTLLRAAA